MNGNDTSGAEIVFLDPGSGLEIREVSPSEREQAAAILTPATGEGTIDAATRAIEQMLSEPQSALIGGIVNGTMVAVYGLRRDGMANDIALIAVDPEHRRRGIGRALLQDALRRSGRRPVVVETDDEGLPFYKGCGFKIVGRRQHPSGTRRWRLGWHAPGASFKGGTSGALMHLGIGEPCAPDTTHPTRTGEHDH